jgi:hypothetical protein
MTMLIINGQVMHILLFLSLWTSYIVGRHSLCIELAALRDVVDTFVLSDGPAMLQ